MTERLHNVNVLSSELLPTPEAIKQALPLPTAVEEFVYRSRGTLRRILDREDPRLFVVVGPCSIHDPAAAREYALRLRTLAERVEPLAVRADARLFRKAAHDHWLEGPDQRPGHGRLLPHREGDPHRARVAARPGGNRCAGRDRGARSDHAAVLVGAHHLDGYRGTHHRIADPSRDGERPVDSGRVQERH